MRHPSRTVPAPGGGAEVWTNRWHVHRVLTENGAVDLHGQDLRERAPRLISVAHPEFRAELRRRVVAMRHFLV